MPPANRNRTARKSTPSAAGTDATQAKKSDANPTTKPVIAAMHVEHEATEGIERIGDILRRRRQQRGDDLQHIADYLCIRKGFLTALENSDYNELPADAYAIGFLRSYATYLGFDGVDAINRYRGEMTGRRRKPSLAMPTPIAEGRTPSTFIMIGAAAAAILIYGSWYGYSAATRTSVNLSPMLPATTAAVTDSPAAQSSPPLVAPTANLVIPPPNDGIALHAAPPADPVASAPPPAPAKAAIDTDAVVKAADKPVVATKVAMMAPLPPATTTVDASSTDKEASPAVAPPGRLALRAEKETWVHIADAKDNTVFDKVMKPGDTYPVPDTEGLKLTTGNSGGIVLVLDGKDLPKLTRDSSILHDIPLDISKLKTSKGKAIKAATRPQE